MIAAAVLAALAILAALAMMHDQRRNKDRPP